MFKLCFKCNKESEFGNNKAKTGINSACLQCQRDYKKNLKEAKKNGTHIPYGGKESKEERKEKTKEWIRKNKNRIDEKRRAYEKKHKDRIAEYRLKRLNKTKIEGIREYGGKCACCGLEKIEFLTIDHIYGRKDEKIKYVGKRLWSKLKTAGWPKDNIQILCFNCNCAKGFWGKCPHQEKREIE